LLDFTMNVSQSIRSTRDQITDSLRDDVLCGRLSAGERVSEASLAQRFGVSRGPIREALSQMVHEGLFVAKPNCGVVIAPPAPPEIRELVLPIRRTLETYALRQIYSDLNADDFRHWDDILFRMERVCRQGDAKQFPPLDVALHRSIMERCGQRDLVAIWHTIVMRMRAHFWVRAQEMDRRGKLMTLHADHARLIGAFKSGSLKTAVKALEDDINDN
jgi:DNA-binding GntR family transcriptional regulator